MSNEISPILATHFLCNKWQNVPKKTFGSASKSTDQKEKEKKIKATTKRFVLHKNAKNKAVAQSLSCSRILSYISLK